MTRLNVWLDFQPENGGVLYLSRQISTTFVDSVFNRIPAIYLSQSAGKLRLSSAQVVPSMLMLVAANLQSSESKRISKTISDARSSELASNFIYCFDLSHQISAPGENRGVGGSGRVGLAIWVNLLGKLCGLF